VHCVLFMPWLLPVLIAPTHKGMARLSWPGSDGHCLLDVLSHKWNWFFSSQSTVVLTQFLLENCAKERELKFFVASLLIIFYTEQNH